MSEQSGFDKLLEDCPPSHEKECRLAYAISASLGMHNGGLADPEKVYEVISNKVDRFEMTIFIIYELRTSPRQRKLWRTNPTKTKVTYGYKVEERMETLLFLRILDSFECFNFDDDTEPFFKELGLRKMVLEGFKMTLRFTMEMAAVLDQYPLFVQRAVGAYAGDMRLAAKRAERYESQDRRPDDETATFISRISKACGLAMCCRSGERNRSSLRADWIMRCLFISFQTQSGRYLEIIRDIFGDTNVDMMREMYEEALRCPQAYCAGATDRTHQYFLGSNTLQDFAKQQSDIPMIREASARYASQFQVGQPSVPTSMHAKGPDPEVKEEPGCSRPPSPPLSPHAVKKLRT